MEIEIGSCRPTGKARAVSVPLEDLIRKADQVIREQGAAWTPDSGVELRLVLHVERKAKEPPRTGVEFLDP